jgi:glycosyltransferase involved in cell wall biosynthesis
MGEVVRTADRALAATGTPIIRRAVPDGGPGCDEDEGPARVSATVPYSHNLLCVNADQTHTVRRGLGDAFYLNRHNIGYWLWELDVFPDRWAKAFSTYQEIWTPTTFCRDAIARVSPLPVFRVPLAVAPEEPVGIDRQHFGLDPDRFVFLFAFDTLSVPGRKNPMAAVRAFARAFGNGSRCQLVIKVNHAGAQRHFIEELRAACPSGAIRVVESGLSRHEMSALTRCADCLVSLHRSEGFGLLIAEAMYFGKPVIVTNYSGNTDFTRPENSLLVDYKLIPVGPGQQPYDASNLWADPDIEHAAHHMRAVVQSAELRAQLSAAGSAYIREHLSIEAVGRAMRERLEASSGRVRQGHPLLTAAQRLPVLK